MYADLGTRMQLVPDAPVRNRESAHRVDRLDYAQVEGSISRVVSGFHTAGADYHTATHWDVSQCQSDFLMAALPRDGLRGRVG